jgi:hypothetical protein
MQNPSMGALPKDVPVPEMLNDVELKKARLKLEIFVSAQATVKIKVLETSGSAKFDQFVIQQMVGVEWTPAKIDGRPVDSSHPMEIIVDFGKGAQTFSIFSPGEAPSTPPASPAPGK